MSLRSLTVLALALPVAASARANYEVSAKFTCEIGGPHSESINTQTACTYRLLDLGKSGVEGTMSCLEKEKDSISTHKYSFSTSCVGSLDVDDTPCRLIADALSQPQPPVSPQVRQA